MATDPTTPRLPPIEELNRLPREAFLAAVKLLFETAPPLAEGLFAGCPYRSYEDLLDRAAAIVDALTAEQKVEVVNAHPRIGERAEAVRQRSALSYREQGYDRDAELDPAERERVDRELAELNRTYEQRFGFRFVVFVNRRPRSEIVEVLRARLQRSPEEELEMALGEMLAIARDRLKKLSATGDHLSAPSHPAGADR